MEEEDNITVKWAQENVETLYSLINNNFNNCNFSKHKLMRSLMMV